MSWVDGDEFKKIAFFVMFLLLTSLLMPSALAYTRTLSDNEVGEISIKNSPEITIIEPEEGERIIWSDEGFTAKGTYHSLDEKSNIYLIVYPVNSGQFWVQKRPIIFDKEGTWEAEVFFGTKDFGAEEDYKLYAILTDEPVEEGLIEKLPSHLAMAKVGVYRSSDVKINNPNVEVAYKEEFDDSGGDHIYILSGGRLPEDPIVVDDDLEVFVNGKIVFSDLDSVSTEDGRTSWDGHPIKFSASYGDTLKIVAYNSGGNEIELSPLYLHVNDQSELLTKGVPKQYSTDNKFFSKGYRISIPPPPPLPDGPNWKLILILFFVIMSTGAYALKKRGKKTDHDQKAEEAKEAEDIETDVSEPKEPEEKSPLDFTPPPITPRTFPPELDSRYTDVELIGKGGFGRVFKAKRKTDDKVVAVKIPVSLDEATGNSFLKEIKAWEELDHPNIVRLYGRNILPIPYFEMEYMDGGGLEEIKKPVDVDEAKRIVISIAEGLRYAHSLGIIHRDLKPHNVLLTGKMEPKITDWGLSKVLAESKTSSVVGFSPVYAAPEQISPNQFGKTDERTDIWQLGVIFYELVSGKLPFTGESIVGISNTIINEEPVLPSELNPEAKEVDDVILTCLEKKKEDRFKNIGEFLEGLGVVDEKDYDKESLSEQLKKTLAKQKENLKNTNLPEEILKHKRMVVETLGKLAVSHAESGDKIGLLNALEDLKFYTNKNMEDLAKAIEQLEVIIKNEGDVSKRFVLGVKNIVHKIKREYEL